MHPPTQRQTAAGLLLALLLVLVGSDGGRAANVPRVGTTRMVLVRIEPDALTKYLHTTIQEELKAPAPDERAILKMRALALLIAARAQNGRGPRDTWQQAALRDNAVKLAQALLDNKIDAARKQSANLYDMTGASAKAERVDLKRLAEQDEVEMLFAPRRRGGLGFGPAHAPVNPRDGIEMKIMMLSRKPPTAAEVTAEAEHIARAAAITAAMADLIDVYAPDKKVGNKDPKDWKLTIAAMRSSAEELEAAAKAKDAKRIHAAARKLNESCVNCHEIFRD